MKLTDRLRAAVFARDRGICAFSGLSLWALDFGTAPFWHMDWADHVRPSSRGGGNTVDNLVCASAFYNYKKRNNTSDQSYLFGGGRPTKTFYWTHGELSAEQTEMLVGHAHLTESDWYFNRALSNILVALHADWDGAKFTRTSRYWLASAHKRLVTWRRLSGELGAASFVRRGLVRYPKAADVRLMLSVTASGDTAIADIFDRLAVHYRANADTLLEFTAASSAAERKAVLDTAARVGNATEPLLAVLKRNRTRLRQLDAIR